MLDITYLDETFALGVDFYVLTINGQLSWLISHHSFLRYVALSCMVLRRPTYFGHTIQ